MRAFVTLVAVAIVLVGAAAATAQQVDIKAPAPPREVEPLVRPPGDYYDATRPSDSDFYMPGPKVRDDPAFVTPLSRKTADGTGRFGGAGWTAPNTPVTHAESAGFSQIDGWFTLGFAFVWGGPPPRRAPAPPPAP